MIIYTEYESEQVLFVIPDIMEPEETGSIMDKFKMRVEDGIYKYFPRNFILRCNEITVYDLCTEQYLGLKNRKQPIDNSWQYGTIAGRLKKSFKLATFHNGEEFSAFGHKTDFRTITISPESTENLEEYLRNLDEIYRFF